MTAFKELAQKISLEDLESLKKLKLEIQGEVPLYFLSEDSGRMVVKVEYYESGNLPSGSIAVLSNGSRLVTESAWSKLGGSLV